MSKVKKINDVSNKKKMMVCQSKECDKKGLRQPEQNFYRCNVTGFDRYPICKECMYKTINEDDIDTVYRALQTLDLVFDIDLWERSKKSTTMTPFRKYMSMIALPQYKSLRYQDSIFQSENNIEIPSKKNEEKIEKQKSIVYNSEKWFGEFSQYEINYLEDFYKKLNVDENIDDAMYIDTVKKLAIASLEMNKAFNEIKENGSDKKYIVFRDTYEKLYKQFNSIKSQIKANSDSLGCFGVVFDKVEKNQWIPEYKPDSKDIYDHLLEQFANINKSL